MPGRGTFPAAGRLQRPPRFSREARQAVVRFRPVFGEGEAAWRSASLPLPTSASPKSSSSAISNSPGGRSAAARSSRLAAALLSDRLHALRPAAASRASRLRHELIVAGQRELGPVAARLLGVVAEDLVSLDERRAVRLQPAGRPNEACSSAAPSKRDLPPRRRAGTCAGRATGDAAARRLARKELIRPAAPLLPDEDGFRFRHLLIREPPTRRCRRRRVQRCTSASPPRRRDGRGPVRSVAN
jgi:hypothetical protein